MVNKRSRYGRITGPTEDRKCVIGKEGEVYVTSLTNSTMLLIWYRIGDRGKLEIRKKCLCENHNPIF